MNKKDDLIKSQRSFKSRLEVLAYLQGQGYKIKKSKLYLDCKKGLLKVEPDGSVLPESVKNYIAHPLSHLSDGTESEKMEKLALERLAADTARMQAQAEHWTIKNLREKGLLVWKSEFERALAKRAIQLKEDLRNFARGDAPEIVRLCDGNPDKIQDVQAYLLERVDDILNRYAENPELKT